VLRHRVSLGATVASTFVMHMIAVSQARSDPRGKAYYRKKLGEGKSRREAMRCLKRRISDLVFKALVADSTRASLAVA
jgi:transposase